MVAIIYCIFGAVVITIWSLLYWHWSEWEGKNDSQNNFSVWRVPDDVNYLKGGDTSWEKRSTKAEKRTANSDELLEDLRTNVTTWKNVG